VKKTVLGASVLCSAWLYGQPDTLTLSSSVTGPGIVGVNLTLSSPVGSEPAAIQWSVGFPSADVMWATVVPGPSGVSAGKSIACTMNSGAYSCVASSANAGIIANGVVASVTLTLVSGLTNTSTSLSQTLAADGGGGSLLLAAAGGSGGGGGGGSGPPVSSLSCSPSTIAPGSLTTCTVTLTTAAPSGGAVVVLGSSSDYISIPSSVTIAAGALSGTFTAKASSSAPAITATLTARSGGTTVSTSINVSAVTLSSITCSPGTVAATDSSACTVSLSVPAPSGGVVVALSSSISAATVPATATIAAGSSSTSITATTSSVSSSQSALITASYSGVTQTASLTIVPAASLSSLTCTLPAVAGTPTMGSASSATCKLTLASSTSATESFSLSAAPPLTAPASVSVPSGSSSATFTINSAILPTTAGQTAALAASGYGISKNLTISVMILAANLTCSPAAISHPQSSSTTCNITMTQVVSTSTAVSTSTNNGVLTVPASVGIAAGTSSSTFLATTVSNSYVLVTVTANAHGVPQTFVVSVGNVPVSSLTCSPTHLTVGSNSTCTVTLVGAAPAGGETVQLSRSGSKLSIPSSIVVAGGVTSGAFIVTALTGYSGPVAITAKAGGASVTATVSAAAVRPRPGRGGSQQQVTGLPEGLSCSPKMAQAGSTVTCELLLTGAAQGDDAGIVLSASSSAVRLPHVVKARPRQSSLAFQVSVNPTAALQTVALQAVVDEAAIEDDITVVAATRPFSRFLANSMSSWVRGSLSMLAWSPRQGSLSPSPPLLCLRGPVSILPRERFNGSPGIPNPALGSSPSWLPTGLSRSPRTYLYNRAFR